MLHLKPMVSIPELRMEASRFASYVEELRDFARGYRMPVGSAEGVRGLWKALDGAGPFREECASMIRSVVYRERGKVPAEELLALVWSAWGGPEVDVRAEELREAHGGIQVFLSGVMRVPRNSPSPSISGVSEIVVPEPIADHGYAPRRSAGIFAAAARTAKADRVEMDVMPRARATEEAVCVPDDVESTLKALELQSRDVQLYINLLKQRGEKQPSVEATLAPVVLNERPASVALAARVEREDPWDEHSELQRELRKFAAERESRAAEYRASKAARPPHIKALFLVEGVLFRLVGSNNFVRRYLSGHLQLLGPDRWHA